MIGEFALVKEIQHLKRMKDPELNATVAEKYIKLMHELPSIHEVSEETIKDIIPKNLEGIFDLMKIYLSFLSEVKHDLGDAFPVTEIEMFFNTFLKTNLV